MRRWLAAGCHGLAWCALVTALPGVWVAGCLRWMALALSTDPARRQMWRDLGPVLREDDVATLLGTHESALRRGDARWQ